MGKSAARWRLRVRAEGAQGLKAASGLMTFDAKPDPYAVFEFQGVSRHCEPVQDVEPLKYFSWPDAVAEFDVADEAKLLQTALTIHVKDRDTLKDRYIGGASIPLAPLYTAKSIDGVLCSGRFFVLEFEDEKLKKKRHSGEIKLTVSVVDTMKKPVEEKATAEESQKQTTGETGGKTGAVMKETGKTALVQEEAPAKVIVPEPLPAVEEGPGPEVGVTTPAIVDPPREPSQRLVSEVTTESAVVQNNSQGQSTTARSSVVATANRPGETRLDAEEAITDAPLVIVKMMKIELVAARDLSRPSSVGAFFDRKPDPMVTIEFYGSSKSTIALKDVDLKKPVEWTNTFLVFELPQTAPPASKRKGYGPMDMIVHIKDDNLVKATYMGGGKFDLSEIFASRSEASSWEWRAAQSMAIAPLERVVTLNYSDEKLSKKKACGELTLRFHFVAAPLPQPSNLLDVVIAKPFKDDNTSNLAPARSDEQASSLLTSSPPAEEIAKPNLVLSSDVKMLSIEVLSGRGLSKPSVSNKAKSMLKSLFDRKSDPYAVLVLGSQTRKCPAVNNVDVSFFEWQHAVQVFEFANKPYPDKLEIHVRDEDMAGSDPYMGGARISLIEIWNESSKCATSHPPGDSQLVKSYPLTFADEKMTKQKDCGTITIRFRWIYSETELPVARMETNPKLAETNEQSEKAKSLPVLESRSGFIYIRKMTVHNNTDILDPSLDLYVEVSCFSIQGASSTKKDSPSSQEFYAKSSVLTDATKGKGGVPTDKVEWIGDELVVPICIPLGEEHSCFAGIRVDLKDKNAVMKDTEIATKSTKLMDCGFDFTSSEPKFVTIKLEGAVRKATKSSVRFEADIQFFKHDSPLLAAGSPEKYGGIVTLFMLRSIVFLPQQASPKDQSLAETMLSLEIDSLATKKTGLLSFGKSPTTEFHTGFLPVGEIYEDRQSLIPWWSTCSFPVSSKQTVAAKEKEVFDIIVSVRMRSGKQEKVIGSTQFNLYPAAFSQASSVKSETIQFGSLGSMRLEFVAAFRAIAEEISSGVGKKKSTPVAPEMPSGYLHLIILHAKNLVSPDAKEEKADELDPEVRVSVEPKYIRRKDNPVRSMLKTRPLENAGAVPTWNEYLRLEYLLPSPPASQASQAAITVLSTESIAKYPPPIVQIGVYDIQMPGEKNGSQVIGKTELPLSAFLLTSTSGGVGPQQPITMSLDIFLADKKTGILVIEGVFEPARSDLKAPSDDPAEVYRQNCKTIGRELREKSKKLKSGELDTITTDILIGNARKRHAAGRLELHLIGFRGGKDVMSNEDRGLSAHLWLCSNVEDRHEVKSRMRPDDSGNGCQIEWDTRMTLFTGDITVELLRSEVLTLTGKTVGSLKLPLGGLLERGCGGQTIREWHPLADTTAKKPNVLLNSKDSAATAHEVLLELTFYADQSIFDPIALLADPIMRSAAVVVPHCRQLILIDVGDAAGMEVACKCLLIGRGRTTETVSNQATVVRTSFQPCDSVTTRSTETITRAKWRDKLKINVEGTGFDFLTRSFASGTLPSLRLEILVKRQNARFQDTVASVTLSLVSVLQQQASKVSRWVKLYREDHKEPETNRLIGLMDVELAVFYSAAASSSSSAVKEDKLLDQAFDDMVSVAPVSGILCLRFLSGRNLVDVDANGEQDPYIITKVFPRSFSDSSVPCACQTAVSLNGGRHPTWNTGIFELRIEDLVSDFVRFEVIDSNEEDHLPDAFIGAVDIALASLFRDNIPDLVGPARSIPKTRWLEAWIPIYPTAQGVSQDENSDENVGELRVEFRFLTESYFVDANRQQAETLAASSPYAVVESPPITMKGTLCVQIAQAFDLQCSKGMLPGLRIADKEGRSYVTKPGKGSIVDPVWENEIFELSCPSQGSNREACDRAVSVEIVDLAVRTANANALPVLAFGTIDISTFLIHPLAKSFHLYPLRARKALAAGKSSPSVLLGCQYIPEGREKDAVMSQQQQAKREKQPNGSLHVKAVQVKFSMAAFLNVVPLSARLTLFFKCYTKQSAASQATKTVEIPDVSLATLAERDGFIDLSSETAGMLFTDVVGRTDNMTITPNPIIVAELVARKATDRVVVLAELEVPVFDYVLFDGHLGSAWYALMPVENSSPQLGEIKLEIQFLPVLDLKPEDEQSSPGTQSTLTILEVHIERVSSCLDETYCVLRLELLGCSVETKPNNPNITKAPVKELVWNETVDLPLLKDKVKSSEGSAIMRIELREAANGKSVLGLCNWIVPKEIFRADGSLVVESNEPMVVPLDRPSGLDKRKGASPSAQLVFRLGHISEAKSDVSKPMSRKGLLYVSPVDDDEASLQAIKAALAPNSQIKDDNATLQLVGAAEGVIWTELSNTERRVVAVLNSIPTDSACLVIAGRSPGVESKDSASMTVNLDASTLRSIFGNPGTDTFHRIPVKSSGATVKSQLACKIMYIEALQGELQFQLSTVCWPVKKRGGDRTPGSFRLEARLLTSSSQRWVCSPIGFWSRQTSEVSWSEGKRDFSIHYTNVEDVTEPTVQLLLVQVHESGETSKEAYGQIPVLSTIASVGNDWKPATVKLTPISEKLDAVPTMSFQIRFLRAEFSFEELEAQMVAEREKKALELAEGTAVLKKAFAMMGGDERTPMRIVDFKKHVISLDGTDPSAVRAREVLQHAANIEAGGDLDRLFALMDVNGDGQISWDEYADHMQNIHALADAAASKLLRKQADSAAAETQPAPGNEPQKTEAPVISSGGGVPSEHEEDDERDGDSDLEDNNLIIMPTVNVEVSADTPLVRDVYNLPTPAGEPTKEMPTERQGERRISKVDKKIELVEKPPKRGNEQVISKERTQDTRESTLPTQVDRTDTRKKDEAPTHTRKKLPLLSTYVLDWKVDEVIQWMEQEMELGQYSEAIQQNAVNGKLLLTLRERELESELGVTAVLHKRKIMNQIREFQERFQYPLPEATVVEKKRPSTAKKTMPGNVVTASMLSETPAFIKKEQLVYQEKQRTKQAENSNQPRTLGQSRVFPAKTTLLTEKATTKTETAPASTASSTSRGDVIGETFDDAMQDIYEAIHPDSPEQRTAEPSMQTDVPVVLPHLPVIQIGSETNTDELFEIVRQRIHQLSEQLLPLADAEKETWSDFGDDPDDADDDQQTPPSEEQTALRLAYNTFRLSRRSSSTERISRLKFQEGLSDLLAIEVSWHQFDLLFRRLDVDGDSELCWDEFHHVFTRRHISFERADLLIVEDALVNFVMDRLDSQQWALSDLFKAFDRDGGGSVSIAEFATLVRFLFTSSNQVKRHEQRSRHQISKRHVYLLMSCLDASADRRIVLQEFLRFFFIVWSNKLMEVQDQHMALESAPHHQQEEIVSSLKASKRKLRRALRTNFSRPFRDAMRCLDVSIPGPFTGLIARLQLRPKTPEDPTTAPSRTSNEGTHDGDTQGCRSLQVWQVLRGHTSSSHLNLQSLTQLEASSQRRAVEESRRRVQKGKNEVQRTRLTRQREPNRADAVLQTPSHHVSLDADAKLKFDFRPG